MADLESKTLLIVLPEDHSLLKEGAARQRLPQAQTCPACGTWHLQENAYCVDASEECLVDQLVHNNPDLGPLSSGRTVRYAEHLHALVLCWEGEIFQDGIWALQATLPWSELSELPLLPIYSWAQAKAVGASATLNGLGYMIILTAQTEDTP